MNNRIEQDHRGIKGQYSPMRGFGTFASAARSCVAHDELRDYFRHRTRMDEVVPAGIQREQFQTRLGELRAMLKTA
jgi:transposase-like protein